MKISNLPFFLSLLLFSSYVSANNAYYLSLSNQLARKQDLEITTNNAANANTMGYEEDGSVFKNIDAHENKRKNNSFVYTKGVYKPGNPGPLKTTNNPLDLALADTNNYFKLHTPRGTRYALTASLLVNSQGILVSGEGYEYLSQNNAFIQVPQDTASIEVMSDGSIYADGQVIDVIGVVYFPDKLAMIKEGNSLYKTGAREIIPEGYKVISGSLRASNVNPARIMGQTVEAQRSFSVSNSLLHDISDSEKQAVSRILKPLN